jgi:hypothetical protein
VLLLCLQLLLQQEGVLCCRIGCRCCTGKQGCVKEGVCMVKVLGLL